MYNHNYDFLTWITVSVSILVHTSNLAEYGEILSRDPRNLTPGWRRCKSTEVPLTKSFHSFPMSGKAPSSTDVKYVVVNSLTIATSSMDNFRNAGTVKEKLHRKF